MSEYEPYSKTTSVFLSGLLCKGSCFLSSKILTCMMGKPLEVFGFGCRPSVCARRVSRRVYICVGCLFALLVTYLSLSAACNAMRRPSSSISSKQ